MMGSQGIAEQADNLLSIIADSDKYKAKIKEMKELAQAITAEKYRLSEAQAKYNEQVKQVSDDRKEIEKAAAKAQADLKEAHEARYETQQKLEQAAKIESATKAQIGSAGAVNANRTAALDKLTQELEAREIAVAEREKAIGKREQAAETTAKDYAAKLARLKEMAG